MQSEAAYWALLTGEEPWQVELLGAWHGAGNRSLRGLFEEAPQALAMLLGLPEEALTPLLAVRTRVPRTASLLDRLGREGVDLVTRWERRYPRALKTALGDGAPPALWHAGPLDLLGQGPVAVFGARDAGPDAVAFARALAVGLAGRGRPVITGVARAIERATLEAALGAGGAGIVMLGQGIARAQPDLRRLQAQIAAGRLLVLSGMAPEAPWQPWIEGARGALAAALAERAAVAQVSEGGGTWATVQAAIGLGRPLYVRESEDDTHRALLAGGALSLPWPAEPDELVALLLPADRQPRGAAAAQGQDGEVQSAAEAGEQPGGRAEEVTPSGAGGAPALQEALLRYLQRSRRRATGKGTLLQMFPVGERELDRALLALIADGSVTERPHRSGAQYSALPEGKRGQGAFQPSLFGQQE